MYNFIVYCVYVDSQSELNVARVTWRNTRTNARTHTWTPYHHVTFLNLCIDLIGSEWIWLVLISYWIFPDYTITMVLGAGLYEWFLAYSTADGMTEKPDVVNTGGQCVLERSTIYHVSFNRRFPRSMRSQGKRPGCGSRVKRVDHEDAVDEWRFVWKRWRVIISYWNLICHGASGPIWANPREYFWICNVIVTE